MTRDRGNPLLTQWCGRVLRNYLFRYPQEEASLARFWSAIRSGVDLASRHTFPLHVTASAVTLDASGARVLLIKHRALGVWLQPGGHLEPAEFPPEAAAREVAEECGLQDLHAEGEMPLDIDIHGIALSVDKKEPEHYHCDFRYVFRARSEPTIISAEGLDVAWVSRELELAEMTQGRMAKISDKLDAQYPLPRTLNKI